jgi:hypothetical protein
LSTPHAPRQSFEPGNYIAVTIIYERETQP